jgi:hypothetical protein
MFKKIIPIFLILICINVVCAAELTTLNEEYNPGETLQAIASNTSLTTSQVSLIDSESNSISISPLVTEYREDNYFIYFNLPTDLEEGTYRLFAGALETNFTITNRTTAVQIKPAFVILDSSDDTFTIKVENLGTSITVLVSPSSPEISPRKSSIALGSESLTNLLVDYDYSDISQDETLTLTYDETTYNIPLFYLEETEEVTITNETTVTNITIENETISEENITLETGDLIFLTQSASADIDLNIEESFEGYLKLQNTLNETLTNLTFTLTGNLEEVVRINLTTIENISNEEIISQYLWVNENGNASAGTYEGELIFSNEEYSTALPIIITLTEEEEIEEPSEETETPGSGVNYDEVGNSEAENNSSVMVIGIVLILLLGGIFLVLFLKLRKGNEKKFQQYIDETKQK